MVSLVALFCVLLMFSFLCIYSLCSFTVAQRKNSRKDEGFAGTSSQLQQGLCYFIIAKVILVIFGYLFIFLPVRSYSAYVFV